MVTKFNLYVSNIYSIYYSFWVQINAFDYIIIENNNIIPVLLSVNEKSLYAKTEIQ